MEQTEYPEKGVRQEISSVFGFIFHGHHLDCVIVFGYNFGNISRLVNR
jgi:hypothetical protein